MTDSDNDRPTTPTAQEAVVRIRYRIRFAKQGLLRWTSHRDLARLWERIIRRASLKPSMTEGFHPKPRIGFPSALALGVEGLDEVVELDLAEDLTPSELLSRLQDDKQPGLFIKSVCKLPHGFGKAQLLQTHYRISIIEGVDLNELQQSIDQLLSKPTADIQRKNKTVTINIQQQIDGLTIGQQDLELSMAATEKASLRPADVLELIGCGDWIEKGSLTQRISVVLQREFPTDPDDAEQMKMVAFGNPVEQPVSTTP